MMRLGFNALRTTNFLPLSLLCAREAHSSSRDQKRTAVVSEVAQKSIENYANIFTQSGDRILIHAHLPAGKPPEKRMMFVKLYMYANHLIGNTDISLLELTRVCNREGYRSSSPKGNKTSKVNSSDFHKSLSSKSNGGLFDCYKDEDGKVHVRLTDRGIRSSQQVAESLNSFIPEEPQGRTKDVLIIFRESGWLKENQPVAVKKLLKACENHGYTPMAGDLRRSLSSGSSQQFFIFDKDRDTVQLSPFGLEAAQSIQEGVKSISPSNK